LLNRPKTDNKTTKNTATTNVLKTLTGINSDKNIDIVSSDD